MNWFARKIWGGGIETRTKEYTTVRTGAIKNALENLTFEVENSIDTTAKQCIGEWKKMLNRDLLKILRANITDDEINIDQFKKVIRNVLYSIEYPAMVYSGNYPSKLSARGKLKGEKAEKFIDNAKDYILTLRHRVSKDIIDYLNKLLYSLKNVDISKSIFGNYDEILKQLEEEISNKAITLDRLSRLKKELEKVEV